MGSLFNYPIYSQVISVEYLHSIKRIEGFSSSEGLAAALLTCTYYSICFLHLLLHSFSAPITPSVFYTYFSICILHLFTPSVFYTYFSICNLHLLLHLFSTPISPSVFCTYYSICFLHLLLRLLSAPVTLHLYQSSQMSFFLFFSLETENLVHTAIFTTGVTICNRQGRLCIYITLRKCNMRTFDLS